MDLDKEFLDLKAQVAAQAAEIARLKARVEEEPQANIERESSVAGGTTSRRQLFKLAGAAAVGSAGASLLSATPAGATLGTMMFGTGNNAGTDQTRLASSNTASTLLVTNTVAGSVALVGADGGSARSACWGLPPTVTVSPPPAALPHYLWWLPRGVAHQPPTRTCSGKSSSIATVRCFSVLRRGLQAPGSESGSTRSPRCASSTLATAQVGTPVRSRRETR
jgi:hypothetical protein